MRESGKTIRIHVYQLEIGMFVSELDIPWEESPFMLQGFDIKSNADIKAVQNVCDYVFIDPSRQKETHGAISVELKEKMVVFADANDTYRQTSDLVKTVMDDIRFGNQLNVEAVKKSVEACVDRVLKNSDAMMLLTQLKNKDEYTSQHSLNVCLMSIMLGRHLNYSLDDLNKLGVCGLMHDMGKMKVPLDILNKEGKLSPEELEVMRSHTTHGRNILMSARGIYPGAVDAAYAHHERLDGQGYPRGVTEAVLSPFVRIVAIVDTYDAITSDRVYSKGRLHLEAINILMKCRDSHFDAGLVLKFIDCIGIYPVGNLVEMKSGEVGVVIKSNAANKTRPKVLILLDADKQSCEETVIDLQDDSILNSNQEPYRISRVLRTGDFGLSLNEIYKRGSFDKAWLAS